MFLLALQVLFRETTLLKQVLKVIAFLECLDVVSQPIDKPAKMHQLYIT